MATLPIVTKKASHDPTTCLGCMHLSVERNGHVTLWCLHFDRKLAEYGENDTFPKLRPIRQGCKERMRL